MGPGCRWSRWAGSPASSPSRAAGPASASMGSPCPCTAATWSTAWASRRRGPARMRRAYHQSAATLNLLRAFTKGGFADLTQVHVWNQEFVARSPAGRRYEGVAAGIDRALRFMAACGIDLTGSSVIRQVDFYTSHEALVLGYEQAMTR